MTTTRADADLGLTSDVPHSLDELTPDWLTDCLRASGAIKTATVMSIEAGPVGVFGMTGELGRLVLSYDHDEPGAPPSLVAKFSAGNAEVRAIVHSMGFYEREASFYRELAADSVVRLPGCYLAWVDRSSGASLLLLEDLSALTTMRWRSAATTEQAEAVIRAIATLHSTWWSSGRLAELPWLRLEGMTAHDQAVPTLKDHWESFLGKLSVEPSEDIVGIGPLAACYLPAVMSHLYGDPPLTLLHNDLQGDNILLDPDGSVALVDWQLATTGRGPVDLGYYLGGNLAPDVRREVEDDLIATYHSVLADADVTAHYSFDQCMTDYRLALLPVATRLASAVGAHPGLQASPDAFWNVVFPRYAQALVDHDVAGLCADLFGNEPTAP